MKGRGLRAWFGHRNGGGGGWVDCNASKRGALVPCGRGTGEKRDKYPACRPTLAACKGGAKGKKKGSRRVSWKE